MSDGGAGFPRTRTNSSSGGGGYRRKVGFEAFEAGPEALFAYTCAVSNAYLIPKGHFTSPFSLPPLLVVFLG